MSIMEFKATKALLCFDCGDRIQAKIPGRKETCSCGICTITENSDGAFEWNCTEDGKSKLEDI